MPQEKWGRYSYLTLARNMASLAETEEERKGAEVVRMRGLEMLDNDEEMMKLGSATEPNTTQTNQPSKGCFTWWGMNSFVIRGMAARISASFVARIPGLDAYWEDHFSGKQQVHFVCPIHSASGKRL